MDDDTLHHSLSLTLLDQFRRRGELLVMAGRHLSKDKFRGIMATHGIRFDQAIHCILLYFYWADVRRAERWSHWSSQPPPTTEAEAIDMLIRWHQSGWSSIPEDESAYDA